MSAAPYAMYDTQPQHGYGGPSGYPGYGGGPSGYPGDGNTMADESATNILRSVQEQVRALAVLS